MVRVQVGHHHQVQAAVASRESIGQRLRHDVTVRPAVYEPPASRTVCDHQDAVALPDVEEVDAQVSIGAIRNPEPKDGGGGAQRNGNSYGDIGAGQPDSGSTYPTRRYPRLP